MRLAMFVDGWNMYGSLKTAGIRGYGWCDFKALARQQTGHTDADVAVKFFTAEDRPNPEKIDKQQKTWSDALEFTGCEIIWGEYRRNYFEVDEHIDNDGRWREKRTDVALASHMVADCSRNPGYDEAILLTQDSDFIPAVEVVAGKPFNKRVCVLLPPSEFNSQQNARRIWEPSEGSMVSVRQLSKADFAEALLPKVVHGPYGKKATCHPTWMWREKHQSEIAGKRATVADLQAKFQGEPQVPKRPAPR